MQPLAAAVHSSPGLDTARRDSALSPRAATPQSLSAAKDNQRLGELIDVIATIELTAASEGEKTHRSVDLLGRVYEYFLTRFASAEGKNGGQFYTPSCVVRCLVELLAPYKGRIYDPACDSGGMFVQSEKFVESQGGVAKCEVRSASVEVKKSRPFVIRNSSFGISPARRLAVMNLALRGIEADFGPEHADTFRRDLHPDLRADWQMANAEVRMWN